MWGVRARDAGNDYGLNVDSDTGEAIDSEDEEMIEITVTRNGNVVYQGTDPDAMEAILQPMDVLNRADGQRIIFQGATHAETKGKGKGFSPFTGKGRRLDDTPQ